MAITRRTALSTLALACGAGGLARLAAAQSLTPQPSGRLVRTMPLGRFDGRPAPPLGRLLGSGLDARQFTDLSTLASDGLITPADRFYIRTAAPGDASPGEWTVRVAGRSGRSVDLTVADLTRLAQPMGTHLLECAGNSDPANFGLLSAAAWTGVSIAALLDRVDRPRGASLVRITGADDDSRAWQTSVAGASWIFPIEVMERAGAFLATGMNGAPLTRHHGFPVRLVVPNWYGCAAIKWVTRIEIVGDDEPPTSQMVEFASRTHQDGVPRLARDFEPAVVDLAAMPIRVEQWVDGDRISYRVVGIRWGGSSPAPGLLIRFRYNEPFVPVEDCPPAASTTTWSMWSHTWRPEIPRLYRIVLVAADRSVRARRLGLFYYTREVEIDRV